MSATPARTGRSLKAWRPPRRSRGVTVESVARRAEPNNGHVANCRPGPLVDSLRSRRATSQSTPAPRTLSDSSLLPRPVSVPQPPPRRSRPIALSVLRPRVNRPVEIGMPEISRLPPLPITFPHREQTLRRTLSSFRSVPTPSGRLPRYLLADDVRRLGRWVKLHLISAWEGRPRFRDEQPIRKRAYLTACGKTSPCQ
jgi:hypothetical protein